MEELRIEANGNLGPIDSSRIPRYAGAATYARLPRLDQVAKADVTVVGVPFDSGVSYRPGARFGANHIREASRLLRPYNPAWDVSPVREHPGGRRRRHGRQPVQHQRGRSRPSSRTPWT